MVEPLHIQHELRKSRTPEALAHTYGLQVIEHPRFNNLVWFGNDGCDMTEPLVRQCRGLILDRDDNWRAVARPFDHIFEWSEPGAPKLKWNNKIRVYDKVDGQGVYMYCYDGQWLVGSKRSPDASEVPHGNFASLSKLFWDTFFDMKPAHVVPPTTSWGGCTFIWELRGRKLAPVVVDRSLENGQNQVQLIAIRSNDLGEFTDVAGFCDQGIRPYYPVWESEIKGYKDAKEVLADVSQEDLKWGEGLVVVDENDNRIAVTHPEYNAARDFRESISLEWIVNNVRSVKPAYSVYRYAPDWEKINTLVAVGYSDLMRRISLAWEKHRKIGSDGDFAAAVKDYPFARVLTAYRAKRGEGSISALLRQVAWQDLLGWMEIPGKDELAA